MKRVIEKERNIDRQKVREKEKERARERESERKSNHMVSLLKKSKKRISVYKVQNLLIDCLSQVLFQPKRFIALIIKVFHLQGGREGLLTINNNNVQSFIKRFSHL